MGADVHRNRTRHEAGVDIMNFRDLRLRARRFIAARRVERELDEELAFHLELEAQKHTANGLSPAEARTMKTLRQE